MDQRLTRSMMDVRLTSTRSKSPIDSISPLHSQPKTSRRSVSPLPNQEKAHKGSVSPFRNFVSPYNNQQKTSRGFVSPNNSQQKTPRGSVSPFRGSVSPYNNQQKTPRGSVSPFRGSVSPYSNQEKTPRGAASPIHNQTKDSIGPVSPLHNQAKVSTGSVSSLHNQPKTPRGYVSPLNNQVKTPRAYVSPIHNQEKAPRAYVSPLIDEENTPAGSISPLHNNEKDPISTNYPSQNQENCNIYLVSPSQNQENPNGDFVSPLQNEENVKTDSVSPIQNQKKPIPNYLKASSSTCHDICKYGSRNNLEEEREKNVVRRKKRKIIKLRSLSSGKIVFSEKIELVSVESSSSNEEGVKPVEWKDIISYDAFASLNKTKTEEIEVDNSNLDVEGILKLFDKNKRQAIRIKDVSSKIPNSVDRRNKKQDLKLKETIVRNEIDKERDVRNEVDNERNDASSKTKMDSSKKAYNRKEENEATTSKSKSVEKHTTISDKFEQIEKETAQKQSIINVLQLSMEKKDPCSKSRVQPENPNSTERKNKKDMIRKDDKEKNNLEKDKKDVSSKTKMDSNKKLYNTKDDKEATTSKSKSVNEESHERFTTKLDKFKSMEKNNKTDMYKIFKEKHSPRKKSFFSITRSSSGRRSHDDKIDKVVNRPKKVLNKPSTCSSNEPKEKTLHTMEQKSRKVGSRLSNSKPKEDQENTPKPEKSKFRKGKVVELPHDQNSPRKLRFRNKRGSNENLSGFQIGRKSLRRKGSINASSSNPNGQIVMLKHRDTQEKKGLQGLFNSIIEETVNKLVKTRKSKVRALVGAFETVISLQDKKFVHVD